MTLPRCVGCQKVKRECEKQRWCDQCYDDAFEALCPPNHVKPRHYILAVCLVFTIGWISIEIITQINHYG